jgi:hypothetical protein
LIYYITAGSAIVEDTSQQANLERHSGYSWSKSYCNSGIYIFEETSSNDEYDHLKVDAAALQAFSEGS